MPLIERCGRLEAWHSNIVGSIPLRARINYDHLKRAAGANYEYLGWCCRNLVELLIWELYVTSSKDNARRLFEDYVIDTEHLAKNLGNLLQIFATEPNAELDKNLELLAKQESILREERAQCSLAADSKYLDVGKIAKELGMGAAFASMNRILSKLVHPTSLSLLLILPPDPDAQLRTFMFRMGLIAAKDGLDVFCEYLKSLEVDTALIADASFSCVSTLRPRK